MITEGLEKRDLNFFIFKIVLKKYILYFSQISYISAI